MKLFAVILFFAFVLAVSCNEHPVIVPGAETPWFTPLVDPVPLHHGVTRIQILDGRRATATRAPLGYGNTPTYNPAPICNHHQDRSCNQPCPDDPSQFCYRATNWYIQFALPRGFNLSSYLPLDFLGIAWSTWNYITVNFKFEPDYIVDLRFADRSKGPRTLVIFGNGYGEEAFANWHSRQNIVRNADLNFIVAGSEFSVGDQVNLTLIEQGAEADWAPIVQNRMIDVYQFVKEIFTLNNTAGSDHWGLYNGNIIFNGHSMAGLESLLNFINSQIFDTTKYSGPGKIVATTAKDAGVWGLNQETLSQIKSVKSNPTLQFASQMRLGGQGEPNFFAQTGDLLHTILIEILDTIHESFTTGMFPAWNAFTLAGITNFGTLVPYLTNPLGLAQERNAIKQILKYESAEYGCWVEKIPQYCTLLTPRQLYRDRIGPNGTILFNPWIRPCGNRTIDPTLTNDMEAVVPYSIGYSSSNPASVVADCGYSSDYCWIPNTDPDFNTTQFYWPLPTLEETLACPPDKRAYFINGVMHIVE